MNPPFIHLVNHPLVQHKLTLMRQKDLSTSSFRRLLHEISMLMAYEVTRDMPTRLIDIETPLEKMRSPAKSGSGLASCLPGAESGAGQSRGLAYCLGYETGKARPDLAVDPSP